MCGLFISSNTVMTRFFLQNTLKNCEILFFYFVLPTEEILSPAFNYVAEHVLARRVLQNDKGGESDKLC